ncbi:MAG: AraC family transcriptional regulator [Clostridia bacterium]|nr:AraC family transcriptional regulator [Clostridia bacterium]
MDLFFDTRAPHIISDANAPSYATPHQHPNRVMAEHDFIYMSEGDWKIGQAEETFLARQGDVLILSAGLSHYGISPCAAGTKTMYIHAFPTECDACSSRPFSESPDGISLCTHIRTYGNPNVRNCFERIIYAHTCGNHTLASAYFDVLLLELKSCLYQSDKKLLAQRIREMITLSDRMLKNTDVARALNIGVKTCEIAFKNTYGTTIHRCLLETRVEQAKFYLINHPDMKLSEVASSLGFYDEFHLSRHFKEICHLSPSAFRKRVQSRSEEK